MTRAASIRPSDLLTLAWSSLRRNRLRSSLTILAIAVGVAVMVFLISLGLGLEELTIGSVSKSAALHSLSIGTPNAEHLPLTVQTLAKAGAVVGVEQIFPQLTVDGQVSLSDKIANVTVIGVDPTYLQIDQNIRLTSGRMYRADDTLTMIVTTGFLKAYKLDLNKTPLITFNLILNKEKFPTLPTLSEISVAGVVNADSNLSVYVPRVWLERVIGPDALPPYSAAKVHISNLDDIPRVADGIRRLGFRVDTVTDTVSEIKKVFHYVQITLGSLGAVAIGVASIGMFNTLTISLLERTKEIGIMKALGVRRGDIQRLFLTEAALMGLIGGLAGISLAVILQQLTVFAFTLLAQALQGTVPQLFVNQPLIFGAFLAFSIIIALLTGLYPARRAMKLNPIEAIRFE